MDEKGRIQGWIKRNERKPVDMAAVAHLSDGSTMPVRLINISHEGCQIEADSTLPIGDRLKLDIPRLGMIAAQVRWSLQARTGLQFLLGGEDPEEQGSPVPLAD